MRLIISQTPRTAPHILSPRMTTIGFINASIRMNESGESQEEQLLEWRKLACSVCHLQPAISFNISVNPVGN
jgi:hypothetical protein